MGVTLYLLSPPGAAPHAHPARTGDRGRARCGTRSRRLGDRPQAAPRGGSDVGCRPAHRRAAARPRGPAAPGPGRPPVHRQGVASGRHARRVVGHRRSGPAPARGRDPGSPRRPALRDDGHGTRRPAPPVPGATGRRSPADDAAADEGGGPLGRPAPASGRRRAGATGVRAGHRRRSRRLGRRGPAPAAAGAVRRHDAVRPDRRRARGHHRAGLGRGRAGARLPLVAPAQPSRSASPATAPAGLDAQGALRLGLEVRRARRRGPREPCRRTRPRGPRTSRPGPPRGRQG